MGNIGSYLLASAYSSMSPIANTASVVCNVNGEPCPEGFGGAILAFFAVFWLIGFVIIIVSVISLWKVFEKAGRPGWAAIIPIYNTVILLDIVKKPTWWVILTFIPFVNVVVSILILVNLAKMYGKDIGFALGLIFLPFIFFPILAFGKSVYNDGTGVFPVLPNTPPTPPQSAV